MPSFTTAAKDEILSNKAVRQHFPNQAVLWADGLFPRVLGAQNADADPGAPGRPVLFPAGAECPPHDRHRHPAGGKTLHRQLAYRVTVDDMADRIDLYNHFAMLYPEGVTFELLGGDEGAGAFVGGVFLACGTLSDPETKYHLEFAVPREELLMMFVALLQDVGFSPLLTQRRGQAHRLPAR